MRCFTGVAAVAWALHLGWLPVSGRLAEFVASTLGLWLFTVLAVGEFLADQWPKTPSRVSAGPLLGRLAMGVIAGACLWTAAGRGMLGGALICAVGAVAGAVTGYQVRGWLVQEKRVKDLLVGLAEDVFCIGLAWWILAPA